MFVLRRITIASLLVVLFFVAQEIQTQNDFSFLGAQYFSRIARQGYYMAAAYAPKERPTVSIPIKFHKQEHALSCEIASLKMILDYRGLNVAESELLALLPFSDRKPRNKKNNTWGDPDEGFVGNIDGSMPKETGYGIYERPLLDLSQRWRGAEIVSNEPFSRLIKELDRGNPIVVWGAVGSGRDNSWYTPSGKFIKAIRGAHVRVLTGYTGTSENPKEVILMDPLYGEIRWSTQKFIADWAKLENRAVVVY